MVDWLFHNFFFALIVPLLMVLLTAYVVGVAGGKPLRIARDFQVCLYCTALIAATMYDVKMVVLNTPDAELRDLLQGAYTLNICLYVALFVSVFFYGVSVCLSYVYGADSRTDDQDTKIVIASACSVGMSVLLVIMARIQVGLL